MNGEAYMATIRDIAQIAGVSTSTVSHVVNETRYVSPALRERVLRAINEADTPPNFVVKKRRKYENFSPLPLVPVFVSDKYSYFQQGVYEKLLTLSQKHGLSLLRYDLTENQQVDLDVIKTLCKTGHTCGVIAFVDDSSEVYEYALENIAIPKVLIGERREGIEADFITPDTRTGAYNATRHLIRNGHLRIAFINSMHSARTRRLTGYKQALTQHGIDVEEELIYTDLSDKNTIVEALSALMFQPNRPTAILVANYALTYTLFNFLNANNIACPKDISVVCFNDFKWAALHMPPITVVDQNEEAVACSAMNLLTQRMAQHTVEEPYEYKQVVIPTTLMVRASTCGIAHGPFDEKAERLETLQLEAQDFAALAERKLTAVVSFHYTGPALMDLTLKGMNSIFAQANISLISINDAHFDPDLQCKQLESISLLDPDIIIAMPVDNTRTAEAFKRISASRAKLVLFTNVPDGMTSDDYVSCVSVNEHAHGRGIGIGLAEYMQKHDLKRFGMLKHRANFYATVQRDRAAEQVLTEEYTDLRLCGVKTFSRAEDAYQSTLEIMNEHPEIQALYIPWEGPSNEAVRALTKLDRLDVAIATGDLDADNAMIMAMGGPVKAISAQAPYEQGVASALAACNALLNRNTPKYIAIDPVRITLGNLLKEWKNIFKEDCPAEIRDALRHNAQYVLGNEYR